jgi:hypothetical protein
VQLGLRIPCHSEDRIASQNLMRILELTVEEWR